MTNKLSDILNHYWRNRRWKKLTTGKKIFLTFKRNIRIGMYKIIDINGFGYYTLNKNIQKWLYKHYLVSIMCWCIYEQWAFWFWVSIYVYTISISTHNKINWKTTATSSPPTRDSITLGNRTLRSHAEPYSHFLAENRTLFKAENIIELITWFDRFRV